MHHKRDLPNRLIRLHAWPVVHQQQHSREALRHKEEERNAAPVVPEGLRVNGNLFLRAKAGSSERPSRSSTQSYALLAIVFVVMLLVLLLDSSAKPAAVHHQYMTLD